MNKVTRGKKEKEYRQGKPFLKDITCIELGKNSMKIMLRTTYATSQAHSS
jgi:hypothetical protein